MVQTLPIETIDQLLPSAEILDQELLNIADELEKNQLHPSAACLGNLFNKLADLSQDTQD